MGARDAIAKLLTKGIKAYHSSPHDFDRFDLSKIGTGEGAQVYGHGIYAAENPAVSGQGGQYWHQFLHHPSIPRDEFTAGSFFKQAGFDREAAIKAVEAELAQNAKYPTTNSFAGRQKMFEEAKRLLESDKPVGPRTYEVNIKADPAHMLDWDKPLPNQPQIVRDVMDRVIGAPAGTNRTLDDKFLAAPTKAGGYEYKADAGRLIDYSTDRKRTTDMLREAGIPGIKYLDEGSRGIPTAITDIERAIKQGGMYKGASPDMWASRLDELKQTPLTSNYVVFDPANIEIMKKYGVVGAPAGTLGMGSLFDQSRLEDAR